jgi:formyl-CoA transferase
LFEEIAQWTRQRTKHEAMSELAEAGVPASAVMDTKDLYDDPHLAAREFITTLDHPQHGEIRLLRWPARMSGSEVSIVPAPMLGQHSREVVAEDLGLSNTDVDALVDQGVIGNESQVSAQ